ncbi:FAD-dependent oxidoreductase, partial [Arthrospira platensis SPKY2]
MGRAVAACHGDHGVDIRCDTTVTAIDDRGVVLDSGEVLAADVVVVGIGVRPATGWLEGSGLSLDDGLVADAHLNVGVPGIYAAGDVVRWPHPLYDGTIRIEH